MEIPTIINYVANLKKEMALRMLPFKNGNQLRNVENRIFSSNGRLTFDRDKGKEFNCTIQIPV